MAKFAWCTYANNPTYIRAACVLYTNLQEIGTQYPFVLLLPFGSKLKVDVPPGMIVRYVRQFDVYGNAHRSTRYAACSNKVHMWRLTEYDVVCWLDSDIVVVRPIDDIFDTCFDEHGIAAAPGCRCNVFKHEKLPTLPHECPFNNNDASYINAGVVLLHPSISTYRRLRKADYNNPFAEQDTFNAFFAGKITVLSSDYNYLNHLPLIHPEVATSQIRIYHFGYDKPWDVTEKNEYYTLWRKYDHLT